MKPLALPIGPALSGAKRNAVRTNLFLMATVIVGSAAQAVRVRNLSATGAQIESATLPATGTSLILRRGSLAIEGRLMWLANDRGGMEFDEPIDLGRWLPNAPGHEQSQEQVDRVILEARTRLSMRRRPSAATVDPDLLFGRIAEELARVARGLEALGCDLAGEPPIVMRHAARLQEIDLAVQTLGHVGRLLTSDDTAEALGGIGMTDLRRRLMRAEKL